MPYGVDKVINKLRKITKITDYKETPCHIGETFKWNQTDWILN